jgi:hypothetical protein
MKDKHNQITANLPNTVSKRLVNSDEQSQARISCSIARVIATYIKRVLSQKVKEMVR